MQSFSMQGHKRVHHVNFLQPCYRGLQHFSFPEYSENSGKCISITLSTHVETVVLLSTQKANRHIDIEITTDELDLTCAEAKATYEQIKAYVKENFGMNVSNLYIAQVKREFGIVERVNYNIGVEGHKVPQVTEEKRKAIIDALKHFKMI